MILAGDIGGTKTALALYSEAGGLRAGARVEKRFQSGDYDSLETIVEEFLAQTGGSPSNACFGVAGPVIDQKSQITNLPWQVSAEAIAQRFDIRRVSLVNDLVALASAVPHLEGNDLCPLKPGAVEPHGNIAVIAPGTGLGSAYLVWNGREYMAMASEGGHAAFSPGTDQQIELLRFLRQRYRHVSFERVCSGRHLPNIYEFLRENGSHSEPDWLKKELAEAADRTPVIVGAALENKAALCVATLDLFVQVLGTAISNMAITILPKGGIYLGGGIPPRILPRLKQPDFLEAVVHRGRFLEMTARIPLTVIIKPKTALFGAARIALQMAAEHG
jgi:glucokinase